MDVAETLETAAEYVAMEFDHMKVKLGQNLQEDIERLAKLREKYGDSDTLDKQFIDSYVNR